MEKDFRMQPFAYNSRKRTIKLKLMEPLLYYSNDSLELEIEIGFC